MKCKVLYFGVLTEHSKTKEEHLSFQEDMVLSSDFRKFIIQKYTLPDLTFSIAINKKIASENDPIKNNDEVAILPPYSGG